MSSFKLDRNLCFGNLQLEKRDKMAAGDGESGGFTKNKVSCVKKHRYASTGGFIADQHRCNNPV